ncbi:hypothetical protein ACH5RR_037130 [Cinchona calisaya]|uniref:Uncharacterized protein n=1 Tax=Cinchona calisaya TaxID=153742 RepID=A0ABD2Y6M2_9GENT
MDRYWYNQETTYPEKTIPSPTYSIDEQNGFTGAIIDDNVAIPNDLEDEEMDHVSTTDTEDLHATLAIPNASRDKQIEELGNFANNLDAKLDQNHSELMLVVRKRRRRKKNQIHYNKESSITTRSAAMAQIEMPYPLLLQ